MPQRTEQAIRLGGQATRYTGRALAESAIRAWWPAVIPLALVSRRVRRAVAVAIVAPPLIDWLHDRPASIDPATAVALRTVDHAAYGAGVWVGAARGRRWNVLRPVFTFQ